MIQSPFASEYEDSDLPNFEGAPASNAALASKADAEMPWTQMSTLLGETTIQAVRSFYLAKRSRDYFSDLPDSDAQVGPAIRGINDRLMRLAVLDIASVNDGGLGRNDTGSSRTASLPAAHMRMKKRLTTMNAPLADLDRLEELRADINPDLYGPLKYIRHLRNKWAGHPSLDRRFDDWAGADSTLSIVAVEAALVRLVNNAHDTGTFVASVPSLHEFRQPAPTLNPDGIGTMGVDLAQVLLWAEIMRNETSKEVSALRAQF